MTRQVPSTMRAAVWRGGEARLRIETIPTPQPARDEVLVQVAACGVCHTDLHVLKGEVAFPGPAVLGHEISGTIVETGPGVAGFTAGDRVVGAFIMPCGRCDACARGRDDLCEVFFAENRGRGNLLDGTSRLVDADGERLSMYSMAGLAEYAVVPASALARLPDELPIAPSAILGCAAFTAHGALRAANFSAGERLAVVAIGGVGSSVVQLAAHRGAGVIAAIDVSDAKLASAGALGATVLVNSRDEDAVAAARAAVPEGFDVVIEALGRPETVELALDLLADGGRLVVVGIAAGSAAAQVPITRLVRRGHAILGSFGARTRAELPLVVAAAADGGFDVGRAVSRRYSLDEADDAYAALARGDIDGRAIVTMSDTDTYTDPIWR